jgi:hypothetical protein
MCNFTGFDSILAILPFVENTRRTIYFQPFPRLLSQATLGYCVWMFPSLFRWTSIHNRSCPVVFGQDSLLISYVHFYAFWTLAAANYARLVQPSLSHTLTGTLAVRWLLPTDDRLVQPIISHAHFNDQVEGFFYWEWEILYLVLYLIVHSLF